MKPRREFALDLSDIPHVVGLTPSEIKNNMGLACIQLADLMVGMI